MKKRTIAYIDGFNLYYGMMQGMPSFKWLDPVRFELKKPILVFNPRDNRPSDLMYHATYYRNIPRDLPAKCQLPDEVALANGSVIRRPTAWR